MLSRTAENLYWLGRCLERAENLARLADVSLQTSTEGLSADIEPWDAVIATIGAREAYDQAQSQSQQQGQRLGRGDFLVHSDYPHSLRSIITRARTLAREIREHLSREVFEEINRLYLETATANNDIQPASETLYSMVKGSVATIYGLFDNTVLQSEGHDWFRCGVFLERADMTSRIVDTKYYILLPSVQDVGGPLDRNQWMVVLRSASALEAFRKRHHGVTGPRVAELLMFDRSFPRSLVYSVANLRQHFERATAETPDARTVRTIRAIAMLEFDLRAADTIGVIRSGLHEFLDTFQIRLAEVDRAITEDIFRAVPESPTP